MTICQRSPSLHNSRQFCSLTVRRNGIFLKTRVLICGHKLTHVSMPGIELQAAMARGQSVKLCASWTAMIYVRVLLIHDFTSGTIAFREQNNTKQTNKNTKRKQKQKATKESHTKTQNKKKMKYIVAQIQWP